MKKIIPLVTLIALTFSGTAMAQKSHNGGFVDRQSHAQMNQNHVPCDGKGKMGGYHGPAITPITVAQAKEAQDEERVLLKGYIIRQIDKNDYVFKDETGEINIEVKKRHWKNEQYNSNDLVEIFGEIDKDSNSIEIEVKRIHKVNGATSQNTGGFVEAPAQSNNK